VCKRFLIASAVCWVGLAGGQPVRGADPPPASGSYLSIFRSVTADDPTKSFDQPWDIRLYVPGADQEGLIASTVNGVFARPDAAGKPGANPSITQAGSWAWDAPEPRVVASGGAGTFNPARELQPSAENHSLAGMDATGPINSTATRFSGEIAGSGAQQLGSETVATETSDVTDELPVYSLVAAAMVGMIGIVWLGILIKKPQLLKEAAEEQRSIQGPGKSGIGDPDRLDIRELL
jgi:hypothetical protein